jgi:hypothetical protein
MQASFAQEAMQSADHHEGSHSLSMPDHHPMLGDHGSRDGVTVNPGVRNAIGVRVAPESGIHENTAPLQFHNAPQTPSAVPTEMNGQVPANGPVGRPGTVRLYSSPPAALPSRSAIGGTALIRPGMAPHGIGGPAKGLAGINGTTLRRKH